MEELRAFRKEKGLSQVQMAEKLNITLSMYEKVERGKAGASAAFMRRVKAAFPDANIDLLFFCRQQQQNCCQREDDRKRKRPF